MYLLGKTVHLSLMDLVLTVQSFDEHIQLIWFYKVPYNKQNTTADKPGLSLALVQMLSTL